jgi:hypothetical protein
MKRHIRRNYAALVIFTLAASAPLIMAQQAASSTAVPVKMLLTVEAQHGNDIPTIHREDVMVHQGRDRMPVKDWVPLQGEHRVVHPD